MRPTRTGSGDPAGPPSGQHRISGTIRLPDVEDDSASAARRSRARGTPRPTRRRRPSRAGAFARGIAGCLTAGFVVLTLVLVGVDFWSAGNGQQGPGSARLITHLVVAVLALALQRIADRRHDRVGGLATFGVIAGVVAAIWFWWWL